MSSPRTPLEGLQELFDRLSRQAERATDPLETGGDRRGRFDISLGEPAAGIDLADHGDTFLLTVDVPGYERDDLEVRVSGDRVAVEGARQRDEETEDGGTYIRRERRSHSFEREITLPEAVVAEGASATVRNGILTVELPKRDPETDTRTIDIE